jgi:hypothetical protein
MKKLMAYIGIGTLFFSLGCDPLPKKTIKIEGEIKPTDSSTKETKYEKEQILSGIPHSSELMGNPLSLAVYLGTDHKKVFVNCGINSNPEETLAVARAKVAIDYIIFQNKNKSEPERIQVSGYFDPNNDRLFTCSKLVAEGLEFKLNAGKYLGNK